MRPVPLLMCFALAGCASTPSPSQLAELGARLAPQTYEQAVDLVGKSIGYTQNTAFALGFVAQTEAARVDGKQLQVFFADGMWGCPFAANANPRIDSHSLAEPSSTVAINCDRGVLYSWGPIERSVALAAAWSKLSALSEPESPGDRSRFADALQMFRAQQVGPSIGEDVRMHKVAAEAAVREKRLWGAVDALEHALVIAPWWPQGNYNLALVYGELHAYGRATRYMQRYLQLVPDAVNARAAQDKVYEWQSAAQRSGA